MRVTPRPVTSPVSTGWPKLVWTNDWAARLNTSSGWCSERMLIIDTSSSRSPGTKVMRSWMWAMRSKFTVELRRTMPMTS